MQRRFCHQVFQIVIKMHVGNSGNIFIQKLIGSRPEYVDQLDLIYSIVDYNAPLTGEITPTDRTFIEGNIFSY